MLKVEQKRGPFTAAGNNLIFSPPTNMKCYRVGVRIPRKYSYLYPLGTPQFSMRLSDSLPIDFAVNKQGYLEFYNLKESKIEIIILKDLPEETTFEVCYKEF